MHAVMDAILRRRRSNRLMPAEMHLTAKSLIGSKFHDRIFAQEHYDSMVGPALDHLIALERTYDTDDDIFQVVGVELSVRFPGIPGAFGTVDLILQNQTHVLHIDWKFGSGVGVAAVYSDGEGAIVNPQLMFYAAAAWKSHNHLYFGGRKPVVAIIQPRGVEPLTHTEVTRRELQYFIKDVHEAVVTALGRDPPRVRGEHCRFAPCKVACPHWTGPLLDLSALGPVPPGMHPFTDANGPELGDKVTPYGQYLAKAKTLVDSLAMLKADIDKQMHAFLEAGGVIPGWRLKAKAKQRKWVDPDIVNNELTKLGFGQDEIWRRELQTFQSADATAKRIGVTIPEALRIAPATTETTIATTSDPAPEVKPHVAIEQFRDALKQLEGR